MFVRTFIISLTFVLCSFSPLRAEPAQAVRVALIQGEATLSIKVGGFYEIVDPQTSRVLYRGRNLQATAASYNGNFALGRIALRKNKLLIRAADSLAITINGRKFRGDIELISSQNSYLTVVNNIGLEDYIKGILYHEASHYWPLEALKAQAIACRSYALYQKSQNTSHDWDVTSDTYSQVYGGRTSERYRTNKAVDETAGFVLYYQGKILPAYFHATCGGYTEDAGQLWNIDLAPLKGVACDFCKESPHFKWHSVLTLAQIEESLEKSDYKIKNIEKIEVLSRNKTGRVINLKITAAANKIEIPAKDFRMLAGANVIRSTNFNLNIIDKDAVFEGIGWGHGVGLCQWGAYFMAKIGKSYEEILKYYYPGAEVSFPP